MPKELLMVVLVLSVVISPIWFYVMLSRALRCWLQLPTTGQPFSAAGRLVILLLSLCSTALLAWIVSMIIAST